MQTLRLRKKTDPENKVQKGEVLQDVMICINFIKKTVEIWNGFYWEETPFTDYKTISSWDGEEGKEI